MASGQIMNQYAAQDNMPPSASYATIDLRNDQYVLDFDASSIEEAYFRGYLGNYNSGGLTVTLVWAASTATTGDVVWGVSFERVGDDAQDLDSSSFASEKTVTAATASASGEVSYDSISFSNSEIDGLVDSEMLRIKVRRVATSGSDTMSGDAELVMVIVKET